jgi:transposase
MVGQTTVWQRRPPAKESDEPKEATCKEPPFQRPNKVANHFGIATRAQVLTLKEFTGLKIDEIVQVTGVGKSEVSAILKRARERGYTKLQPLQDAFFADAARTGRPTKINQEVNQQVREIISQSRQSRTLTCVAIARQLKQYNTTLTPGTVWRILRIAGYHKVKPTKKPGLTAEQRKARLAWCLEHKDWTLEDWKKVLWSDETSVVYGVRRGGERVWRTVYEQSIETCKRQRWKGFSEFMFWGCFSYDYKGPCHVWTKETAAEKKKAKADLDRRNLLRESNCKLEWELSTGFRRQLNLRGQPKGKTPEWKFNEANGKLVRKSKAGGIDWYRYQEEILKKKLLPFAIQHSLIVQEDSAPAHKHKENEVVYSLFNVRKLLWPGNSPDLNMIEPCWWWLKRRTVLHRDYDKKPELRRIWLQQWQELDQKRIQRWVKRIIRHIREVIRLEGGNGYREGGEETELDRVSQQLQSLSLN